MSDLSINGPGTVVTPEDAQVLKDRLSSPPVWPSIEEQLEEQRKFANDGDAAPQGRCPSCERVIPLFSEKCPFCNANFGKYASWSNTYLVYLSSCFESLREADEWPAADRRDRELYRRTRSVFDAPHKEDG